ncbi:Ig-like domain-containing protein [Candidatus Gottesmanbacteria bacterium]|nr:Ig-like domain-containing protein [Candidatus Gottesmanbacteria bacterium]
MFSNKLPWIVVLFFIFSVIIFIISILITSGRTSFFGLASTSGAGSYISQENSYIFASPLQAQSGRQQQIRITLFILNSQGLGVSGETVSLVNDLGLTIDAVQPVTDNYGKAIFDLSSQNPGKYKIMAKIGSTTLPQSVTISFN